MDMAAIRKVADLHAREHWAVQALIAVAGAALAAILDEAWPLGWAALLMAADTLRAERYERLAQKSAVSGGEVLGLALFGALCQIGFASVPLWLVASHEADATKLGIIMLCGAALRQANEFSAGRLLGWANFLPYLALPAGLFVWQAFEGPREHWWMHLALAAAIAGYCGYCLIFWLARERAEVDLAAAQIRAERQRDAAAIDAAVSKLMFQHSQLRAAVFDHNGRFVAINHAWLQALAKTEAQVLGRTLSEVTPNVPADWVEAVRAALQGRVTDKQGDRRDQPDGRSTVLDWTVEPWRTPEGAVGGAVAYARDVTDLHRARAAEQAKQERLELALRASKAFIWEVDYVEQTVSHDEAAVAFFGRAPSFDMLSVDGKDDTIHPADVEARRAQAKGILRNGGHGRMEHRHILPDGSVRWVRSDVAPAPGQGSRPTRFVLLTRDVTEEMNRHDELAAMLGRARAALIGKRALLAEIGGDATADAGLDIAAEAKDTGLVAAANVHSAVNQLFERLDLILTEIDGRDAALASAVHQLRDARARAEAASLAKSQFLATMSHELRTPLNAIIGYSEILIEDLAFAGRPESAADAERVAKSARHLLALIEDILDLSKIDAGRLAVTRETVRLDAMIGEVVARIEPTAAANGNALEVSIDTDQVAATADPERLRQCLRNVLSNAVKFTCGGQVRVRLTFDADDADAAAGPRHRIEVTDTGIGIAADDLAGLFKPFSQVDGSNTRRHGGGGLGLALTREFMRLMGGDVTVRSTPGEGSTFVLLLPLETADAATAPATTSSATAELAAVGRAMKRVAGGRPAAPLPVRAKERA
jgi:PAS domain S-box-containing protein